MTHPNCPSLLCPACGCIISDDVDFVYETTFKDDRAGYGTASGALNEWGTSDGVLKTMRQMRRLGGKGDEASKANRELNDISELSRMRRELASILARLTGHGTTQHPLTEPIFASFKQLRERLLDPEELGRLRSFLSRRNSIAAFTWGGRAQAALCACIYATFRQRDLLMQDAAEQKCYSLAQVAFLAEVPLKRAQKWMRAVRIVVPREFAQIKSDAPILHVDQIVEWFAANKQNTKLITAPSKSLSSVDFAEVRRMARRLCHQILQGQSFSPHVYRFRAHISCGEWGYFAVLWAIAGQIKKPMAGNVWIKHDWMHRSLGEGANSQGELKAASPTIKGDEMPDAHIAAYHLIGDAIAQRAACIPWLKASDVRRTKRRRANPDEMPNATIKDNQIAKYIDAVIDFGPELEQRFAAAERVKATVSNSPLQSVPLDGDARPSDPPEPSYTSLHQPHLSAMPSLIDALSDEGVDDLFSQGEMDSYFRTDEEVAALRTIRADDWKDEDGDEKKHMAAVEHHDANEAFNVVGIPPSSVRGRTNRRLRRTKADERLLAFARGDGMKRDGGGFDACQQEADWSSDDSGSDDSDN